MTGDEYMEDFSDIYHKERVDKEGEKEIRCVIKDMYPHFRVRFGKVQEMRLALKISTTNFGEFFVDFQNDDDIIKFINRFKDEIVANINGESFVTFFNGKFDEDGKITHISVDFLSDNLIEKDPHDEVFINNKNTDLYKHAILLKKFRENGPIEKVLDAEVYKPYEYRDEKNFGVSVTFDNFKVFWKFRDVENIDEKLEYLVETVGGGEPKYIDGTTVYIVPSDIAPDEAKSQFGWSIVASKDEIKDIESNKHRIFSKLSSFFGLERYS